MQATETATGTIMRLVGRGNVMKVGGVDGKCRIDRVDGICRVCGVKISYKRIKPIINGG